MAGEIFIFYNTCYIHGANIHGVHTFYLTISLYTITYITLSYIYYPSVLIFEKGEINYTTRNSNETQVHFLIGLNFFQWWIKATR